MFSPLPHHIRAILKDLHFEIMTFIPANHSADERDACISHAACLVETYLKVVALVRYAPEEDRDLITSLLPMHVRDWAAAEIPFPQEMEHYVVTKEGWISGEDAYRDFYRCLPKMN